MTNSVQKRSLKLTLYQNEVKNNENCQFLMLNVKKSLNGVHILKKKFQKICEKNSSRRSPARYQSTAQHCQNEEPARHVFLSFSLRKHGQI